MGFWGKVRQVLGAGESGDPPSTGPAPAQSPAAKTASPRELFAAEVEAVIRAAPSIQAVRRNPDAYGFLITRDGHGEQMLFLDNVFLETRDMSPEQRRGRIAMLVRSMYTPDGASLSWEDARPKLAPLLRTAGLFLGAPGIGADPDKQPLRRPFAPFLIECVGLDSQAAISYVSPGTAAGWGVEATDVFAASAGNGAEYFRDDVAPYDAQSPYPLWHVARDDSYESSRLLVPGWLASFEGKVKGRPVAIVPHRSLLVVGGDGDEQCLRRLVATAKGEFEGSPRRISPALYTTDDEGRVVPLVVPREHPLAADVALGHVLLAISEYGPQQKHLQERLGDDVFVPTYNGLRGKDGSVFSYTTWTEEVPSLLPEADQVALVLRPGDPDQSILRVPWRVLVDLAGDCLAREPGLDPPRWRTKQWPDGDTLAKLRAAAVA